MKGLAVLLLSGLAFLLIGRGLSLHNREATTLGMVLAAFAILGSGWLIRNLLRLPEAEDALAHLKCAGDRFQSVGLALAETAAFGEKRLVLNLDCREGNLNAALEGSQGVLPVPQVVLAAVRDLVHHLQQQGKQVVPLRWTVSREEDGPWLVSVTFP